MSGVLSRDRIAAGNCLRPFSKGGLVFGLQLLDFAGLLLQRYLATWGCGPSRQLPIFFQRFFLRGRNILVIHSNRPFMVLRCARQSALRLRRMGFEIEGRGAKRHGLFIPGTRQTPLFAVLAEQTLF